MKKIICMMTALILCLSFAACGKIEITDLPNALPKTQHNQKTGGSDRTEVESYNPEGVTTEPTEKGTKFFFKGFFSTILPEGITAQDNSINNDSSFFTVYDSNGTYLDITFYTEGTSEEKQKEKAATIASVGNAKAVDPITVNGVTFYGAHLEDYGKIQYCGYVGERDVDISLYIDKSNEVVTAFLETIEFVKE